MQQASSIQRQSGSVLLMILVVLALVALLAQFISKSTEDQSDVITKQTKDNEISLMLTQASALGGAIQQMIINGENPATLYSNLSQLKPGDAGFETSPYNFKIYHPLGGGVQYMASSTSGSNAIATNFNINAASIVTGVGATDAGVGDILFTATISSQDVCQRINQVVNNSSIIPVMTTSTFNALFTAGTTVTITAGNCAGCVTKPQMCVSNSANTAWGYYASLLPG